MSVQDPATHARARQQAAFRYDAAKHELKSKLDRRIETDRSLAAREQALIERRKQTLERTSHTLVPLFRFIEKEIRQWADQGLVEEGLIDPEDIMMTTVINAAERASSIPMPGIYPWLREVSRKQVRKAAGVEAERAMTERSLETPMRVAGEDWPDRILVLNQVLADPNAVMPEDIIEHHEVWDLLDYAVNQLPLRWREVFLLRSVDAWDDDEIAAAEGIDVEEVEVINLAARAFLREYLRENEFIRPQ